MSNYARGAEMIYVGIRLQLKGGGKPIAKNMAVKNDCLKALKETVVKKASNIVIEQSTAVQPLTSDKQKNTGRCERHVLSSIISTVDQCFGRTLFAYGTQMEPPCMEYLPTYTP